MKNEGLASSLWFIARGREGAMFRRNRPKKVISQLMENSDKYFYGEAPAKNITVSPLNKLRITSGQVPTQLQ